ncbi:hypothetical protein ACFFHM_20695 [Halalkalibacter kiskunsagensis]|uniref:ApeA N-terminal domain-containing protein n=1 Tax=Halalkalibacter kiskunsagensis TaxID=1548599 RepID=A0ABV6KHP5_9BACI
MYKFECEFYLATDPYKPINTEEFFMSEWQIGNHGSLYSEKLILKLGNHYDVYDKNKIKKGNIFNVKNTYSGVSLGSFYALNSKTRSSDVSGDLGEAIAITGLTSCIGRPMNELLFQRFTSNNQCPDFRIETNIDIISRLWDIAKWKLKRLDFPDEITMEVKSSFTDYERPYSYPHSAISQLFSFWNECEKIGEKELSGFGIIARVLFIYKIPKVRYYLFIPKASFGKRKFKNYRKKTEVIRDYAKVFFNEV